MKATANIHNALLRALMSRETDLFYKERSWSYQALISAIALRDYFNRFWK